MKALVLAFTLILSLQVLLSAQSPPPPVGHFKGVVQDLRGSKIGEARITVNGEDGWLRKLASNKRGEFELDLPSGTYRIVVEKSGFADYELTNLSIESDAAKEFVFKLERRNRQS